MVPVPLDELHIVCTSIAEHAGYVALADLSAIIDEDPGLVIGGHMVSAHAYRWSVEIRRETADADVGVPPSVVQSPSLIDRLAATGYSKIAGNRFARPLDAEVVGENHEGAVIDVLVPAYTSRPRSNRSFGDHLVTTEVPGLATALKREPVIVPMQVTMLDGQTAVFDLRIPDELGALVLKVMACTVRTKSTDAIDVLRMLEVAFKAEASIADLDENDSDRVRTVLTEKFCRGGTATRFIVDSELSLGAKSARVTRLQALIASFIGS